MTENKNFSDFSKDMNDLLNLHRLEAKIDETDDFTPVYLEKDVLEMLLEMRNETLADQHLPSFIEFLGLYHEEIVDFAKEFMKSIQYHNGMVSRVEEETYPKHWVNAIAMEVAAFMQQNSEFELDEDVIDEICEGETTEVQEKYGSLEGFTGLYNMLSQYFNSTEK